MSGTRRHPDRPEATVARANVTAAHPAAYRHSILLAALVALAVWWGLGLPYSMFAWLLDERQRHWTLICYAWEVPAAGLLGPVLFPQIWWRRIERCWDRIFASDPVDPVEAGRIEAMILDYPLRVAWVFFVTSVLGYAIGALQLAVLAQLPIVQLVHVGLLGMVTGLVGGLFAFLYLERILAPLLRDLGLQHPTAPPTGRRIAIRTKVFVCSFVLMAATVPLFGTVFWNEAARVLEQEAGKRLLVEAEHLATALETTGASDPHTAAGWQALTRSIDLGTSGYATLVDDRGRIVAGDGRATTLADEHFRAGLIDSVLSAPRGHAVSRAYTPRIVAYARTPSGRARVMLTVPRSALDHQLRDGLRTAGVIFLATLALALAGGYLFAIRLSRPLEIVTAAANRTARHPGQTFELAPVRTNDEVGALAVALNDMTTRLNRATDDLTRYSAELEDRVRAATRDVTMLYDTTRAVTSTLDLDDVLRLIGEHVEVALGLGDVVLLRYSPHDGTAEAYAPGLGHVALDTEMNLSALSDGATGPVVRELTTLRSMLPAAVRAELRGPRVLCLPLLFNDLLIGTIVASLASETTPPNPELAGALGAQIAVALANVGLFETVKRHERELLELTERQVELREETLRGISRDLHDGLGQSLTAIKIELGLLEHAARATAATLPIDQIQSLQGQISEVIQEVRNMSQLLRPSMLDDLGLVPSIRSFVEGAGRRTGLTIALRLPADDERLPAAIEVLLYRVTQEAFTNMAKHAHARRAELTLEVRRDRVMLTIIDDGVGFDAERLRRRRATAGVGLLGMRERVAYHGGRIEIRSQRGAGVQIRLSIPRPEEPRGAAPAVVERP